ncbi:MAG: hypothetical protein AAGD25_16920 [Cyanobacteria bacterium P01_F01_bin.150]
MAGEQFRKVSSGPSNANVFWLFCLLVSLIAHGLVLLVPRASIETEIAETEVEPEDTLEEKPSEIVVSNLPASPPPKNQPDTQSEQLEENQLQQTQAPNQPIIQPVPVPQPIYIHVPQPIVESPAELESKLEPKPNDPNSDLETQLDPDPDPLVDPNPDLDPLPLVDPNPDPDPLADPNPDIVLEGGLLVPFTHDSLVLEGSESGCFKLENCRRVSGQGTHRAVGRQLAEQLTDEYEVDEQDDLEGYIVLELRKKGDPNSEVQYLSVFSEGLGTVVYVLTQEMVSLDTLRDLETDLDKPV